MAKFNLLIKGNFKEAHIASLRHNLETVGIWRETTTETGLTTRGNELDIANWFVEEIQAPFPGGTLLFYSEVKEN